MTTEDRLGIRMLGGFSVAREGRPIDLPTRKAEGLLALLAFRPGVSLGRERLSDLLWSRSAPAQARASLRQALAQLRRALETDGTKETARAGLFETVGDSVRLRPECVAVDTAELESALDRSSPESLQRALALYRGDLLDGFALHEAPFEDWLQTESERLRRRTLQALTRHFQERVRDQDVEAALSSGSASWSWTSTAAHWAPPCAATWGLTINGTKTYAKDSA